MDIDPNMLIIFAIVIIVLFYIFNKCTFNCKGVSPSNESGDNNKFMNLVNDLQKQKDSGDVQEIDMDTLMNLKKEGRLGLIEVNDGNIKENYGLYSGYYHWKPYGYHHYYYPYRRYLRPYQSYYYPGMWRRHYGNYYYTW